MRAENWGAVPLLGSGAGSPSNTMWSGMHAKFHLDPSKGLATDRQTGQRSDSSGRTVLQTVAQQLSTLQAADIRQKIDELYRAVQRLSLLRAHDALAFCWRTAWQRQSCYTCSERRTAAAISCLTNLTISFKQAYPRSST